MVDYQRSLDRLGAWNDRAPVCTPILDPLEWMIARSVFFAYLASILVVPPVVVFWGRFA